MKYYPEAHIMICSAKRLVRIFHNVLNLFLEFIFSFQAIILLEKTTTNLFQGSCQYFKIFLIPKKLQLAFSEYHKLMLFPFKTNHYESTTSTDFSFCRKDSYNQSLKRAENYNVYFMHFQYFIWYWWAQVTNVLEEQKQPFPTILKSYSKISNIK